MNSIREYDLFTNQIQLEETQKALCVSNSLKDPARTYYNIKINSNLGFYQTKEIILDEYDSDDIQREAQSRLGNLRISNYMADDVIYSESTGLSKLCAYIDRLNYQCMRRFRNDTYKFKMLILAVASYKWSEILKMN